MKVKKLIIIPFVLLSFSICACGMNVNVPNPTPTKTPSNSDNNSSNDNSNNNEEKIVYDLPINISAKQEDSENSTLLYEVSDKGIFTYNLNEELFPENKENFETKVLTSTQIKGLMDLIKETDIETLSKEDKPYPDDIMQDTSIRTIETIKLIVNDKEKTYQKNDRKVEHSEKYLTAFDKIKNKLSELTKQNDNKPSEYTYSLPLKVENNGECDLGKKVIIQINEDGKFTYSLDNYNFEVNETKTRTLSESEISKLNDLLKNLDIAKLAEKDEVIPPDFPQTEECRTIENFSFKVNGENKTFDLNGRKLIHTKEYREALLELKQFIETLKVDNNEDKTFNLNSEFALKIGEIVTNSSENITIKLNSLIEESRCPTDVQCIQSGQATFKLTFTKGNSISEEFNLTERGGNEELGTKKIDNYTVKLVNVDPSGFKAENHPKISDYTVTLKITK